MLFNILKTTKLILLLATAVILGSCNKKDLPQPIEETPQIWLECKINNMPYKLEVGEDLNFSKLATITTNNDKRQFISEIESHKYQQAVRITINNFKYSTSSIDDDMNNTIQTGNYNFSFSNNPSSYPFKPQEVIIDYRTCNSCWYSSLICDQTASGSFEIVSVKDVNYEGKNYKLAEIKFSCAAKNTSNGSYLTITDGHGFIPFGE